MSKTIRIDVTNDDIVKGNPGYASSCAIARSVKRLLDGENCKVDGAGIHVAGVCISIPIEAYEFILEFDKSIRGRMCVPPKPDYSLFCNTNPSKITAIETIEIRMDKSGKRIKPFSFQLEISDELYNQLFGIEPSNLANDAACVLPTTISKIPTVTTAVSVVN